MAAETIGQQFEGNGYDEARLRCIAKCIFALNEEGAQILVYLIKKNRGAIVKEIARDLGRNPEVVRRALRTLYARSLVERRPYPLRRGGRAYIYQPAPGVVEAVRKVCHYVHKVVDELVKNNKNEETHYPPYYYASSTRSSVVNYF